MSAPPAGPRPREPGPGGSRKPLLFGGIAILAAGALAATFFVLRPRLFHEHPVPGSRTTPSALTLQPSSAPASAPSSAPASSSAPSQEQAANGLAGLLGQSVKDRNAIVQAVNDVEQCGPNLNKDPQTLQAAAASRQNLLSQLANLPQRSALPQDMLAALTTAWQSSVEADQDFARWAQDEISRGCTQNDQSDPNAQAAVGPDQQATTSKQDFVQLWNPVASRYRLPTYRWNQL